MKIAVTGANILVSLALSLLPVLQSIAQTREFELMHLWLTDIESHALKAIVEPAREMGVTWSEHRVESNFYGVRTEFADRLALGRPPTGVFWIGGSTLKELVDDDIFRLIPNQVDQQQFSQILLTDVYEALEYKGGITALPVGIHLQNHVIYNKDLFDRLGLALPTTWEDMLVVAEVFRRHGIDAISMSDQRWQLRFLFPSIFASFVDYEEFAAFLDYEGDPGRWNKPLTAALSVLDRLRPYVNQDHADLAWHESVKRVLDGRAAANFLGDFSSPYLGGDDRFFCALPPGNRFLLWSLDTVALSNTDDPVQKLGQQALIEVLSTPKNLIRYGQRKGGIPVVRQLGEHDVDRCSRESVVNWHRTKHRIHLGPDIWSRELNAVASEVQAFWRSPGVTPEAAAGQIILTLKALRDH